ncbi:MAG: response regulator transcription factor, partial [Chloroflexota bacterium]
LDLMMPDMDGWTVCARIREMSDVPIMMLTGLNSDYDLERGLELGADHYLVKPVTAPELTARVKAALRRTTTSKGISTPSTIISHLGLEVDVARHSVSYEGQAIHLTPTEFKLLVCLTEHRGRILPHNFILERVWGVGYEENRDILRLYIQKLRVKLTEATGLNELIQAHWGVGYRFD